jgi:acyl-CoA synthetase (AMP-forming)/AMP-acid ligase II
VSPLFAWLDAPDGRGIRFAAPEADEWSFTSYPRLEVLTRRAAAHLSDLGVSPGDVVLLPCPTSLDFVAFFYGALWIGATPSPLPPPTGFENQAEYNARITGIAGMLAAKVLVTTPDLAAFMEGVAGVRRATVDDLPPDGPGVEGPPRLPELGLIQFSSGSTGAGKGIRLSTQALDAQLSAITSWLGLSVEDSFASWLPLHHDMGLISMLLLPLSLRIDLWLMSPQQFVRSPIRWLRRFGLDGVTGSAAPDFALSHVRRRVRPAEIEGWDLSRWQALVIGAEPIDAANVRAFSQLLAPAGFDPRAVKPAYGMAETTLAVTGSPVPNVPHAVRVDPVGLVPGSPVRFADAPDGVELVACGPAVPGAAVAIVDEDGAVLPEGVLGEIRVEALSLGEAWIAPEAGLVPIPRPYPTGDAGFVYEGELYVLGRIGDGVKYQGRWISAEETQRLAAARSPRPGRTVALMGVDAGRATAVLLVEGTLAADEAQAVGAAVARRHPELAVVVADAPAGWIERTTSGKPKRGAMWRKFAARDLQDRVRWRTGDVITAERGVQA